MLAQVRVLDGAINGIRVRFIDTPGLQAAASAVGYNARVLGQIRKAHRKYKPDNVLYFDRMDKVRSLVLIALLCFWSAFPVRQSRIYQCTLSGMSFMSALTKNLNTVTASP